MSWRRISKRYYDARRSYRKAKKPSTRARWIGNLIGWASR